MRRLRWGILGPGRIAPRIARALSDNPRGELHAVASRDPERARAFGEAHGAVRVHDDYDALLADPDVDVVYVALPNHLHAPLTVHAVDVPSVDDCRSEVDNLQAAILDGARPRVDLAFSRGTISTLVALDRSARASLVHA